MKPVRRATIGLLRERDGIAYIARLGRRLMGGLNEVFQKRGYPLRVRGWPAMPELAQVDNPPLDLAGKVLTEWCVAMQRRGFYMTGHCWFISLAHTVDDIERTVAVGGKAVTEVLATITRQPVASATLATGCGEIVFVLRVEG